MNIVFNYDIVNFRIRNAGKVKTVVNKIIADSSKKQGKINFVFTSDERMLDINKEFLNHDYFTDIITFDYCTDKEVSGEIYIGVPTVRENAGIYGKTFKDEIHRVIFHGALHLCGFDDQTDDDIKKMRSMEEKYLVFLSL
jgi:probable rRNA maturation factor